MRKIIFYNLLFLFLGLILIEKFDFESSADRFRSGSHLRLHGYLSPPFVVPNVSTALLVLVKSIEVELIQPEFWLPSS